MGLDVLAALEKLPGLHAPLRPVVGGMELDTTSAYHVARDVAYLIIYDAQAAGELDDGPLKGHERKARDRPLQAHDVPQLGQPLRHVQGDAAAGPEGVVHDDAHVRGLGGGHHELEEIRLRRGEVVGRRHLDVLGAHPLGRLCQLNQLAGAGGLRSHDHGNPAGRLLHHRVRQRDPLVERHGREVPGRPTGQQNAVARPKSAVEKEPDVPPDSRQVQPQIAVSKHRGDGDVAPTEAVAQSLSIHISLLGVVILRQGGPQGKSPLTPLFKAMPYP